MREGCTRIFIEPTCKSVNQVCDLLLHRRSSNNHVVAVNYGDGAVYYHDGAIQYSSIRKTEYDC